MFKMLKHVVSRKMQVLLAVEVWNMWFQLHEL